MRARDVKPGMSVAIMSCHVPVRYGIVSGTPFRYDIERLYRIPIIDQDGTTIRPPSNRVFEYRKGIIITRPR